MRVPNVSYPSALTRAATPHLLQASCGRPRRLLGLNQARVVITFLGDGWVVRIQPTCSSRVAGGIGVSVSNWT